MGRGGGARRASWGVSLALGQNLGRCPPAPHTHTKTLPGLSVPPTCLRPCPYPGSDSRTTGLSTSETRDNWSLQ